jgi:hypothetical protein
MFIADAPLKLLWRRCVFPENKVAKEDPENRYTPHQHQGKVRVLSVAIFYSHGPC